MSIKEDFGFLLAQLYKLFCFMKVMEKKVDYAQFMFTLIFQYKSTHRLPI